MLRPVTVCRRTISIFAAGVAAVVAVKVTGAKLRLRLLLLQLQLEIVPQHVLVVELLEDGFGLFVDRFPVVLNAVGSPSLRLSRWCPPMVVALVVVGPPHRV